MKTGDSVKVFPQNDPAKAATGQVILLSNNERSIAVGFGDKPPFMAPVRDGMFMHPQFGAVLLAIRDRHSWLDINTDERIEIEAAT